MPICSERDRGFGGTYRLHLQDRNVSQTKKQDKYAEMSRCFMVGLPFDSEGVGDMTHRILRLFPN
jgi:hypothetical protein